MGLHIGLNGKTIGWMSREDLLAVSLIGLAVMLAVFTWQVKRRDYVSQRLLLRHCVGAGVMAACLLFVLLRNL